MILYAGVFPQLFIYLASMISELISLQLFRIKYLIVTGKWLISHRIIITDNSGLSNGVTDVME